MLRPQYKSSRSQPPHVQAKQHADVTFVTPPPISGGHVNTTLPAPENSTQLTQLTPSVFVSDAAQHDVTSADKDHDSCADLAGKSTHAYVQANGLPSLPSAKESAPELHKKMLRREMAIERSDSSGGGF